MSNALRPKEYIRTPGDSDNELADFFRRAHDAGRKGGGHGSRS